MFLTLFTVFFIIAKVLMGQGQDLIPMSLSHILTVIGLDIIIYQNYKFRKPKLRGKKK